jgi:DNA-binding MltR family transcriptional regulator
MDTPEPGPDFDAVTRLQAELKKESDRGAVLVASAMIEEALRELLVAYLVPNSSSNDSLFDGTNAPLQSYSSKIDAAFRMGVISDRFCRDLHVVRRIRNDVAHRPSGCDFVDSSIKDRVAALSQSHGIFRRSPKWVQKHGVPTTRDQFIEAASWMLFYLCAEQPRIKSLIAADNEFGYSVSLDDMDSIRNAEV